MLYFVKNNNNLPRGCCVSGFYFFSWSKELLVLDQYGMLLVKFVINSNINDIELSNITKLLKYVSIVGVHCLVNTIYSIAFIAFLAFFVGVNLYRGAKYRLSIRHAK